MIWDLRVLLQLQRCHHGLEASNDVTAALIGGHGAGAPALRTSELQTTALSLLSRKCYVNTSESGRPLQKVHKQTS
jgi:hypothetical protein